MNIGYVKHKTNGLTGAERKEWFELGIRMPFMESATFTISANKKKENSTKQEPDFKIYYSYNRKGEKYRRVEAGALWNRTTDDGLLEYKSGNIQNPLFPNGILYFSVFAAKPFEGENPENITWSHDVIWTPYNPNKNEENNNTKKETTPIYTEIDDDEIPF